MGMPGFCGLSKALTGDLGRRRRQAGEGQSRLAGSWEPRGDHSSAEEKSFVSKSTCGWRFPETFW